MPPPECQLCEDTVATLHCKQCQENFCQEVRAAPPRHVTARCALHAGGARGTPPVPLPPPSDCAVVGQCFDALHYSGKRQGHEVTPVQGAQSSPAKPPPPAAPPASTAPIGECELRAVGPAGASAGSRGIARARQQSPQACQGLICSVRRVLARRWCGAVPEA